MVSGLYNLKLQQFSFLYIQSLHNDCSHIEDVHLLFCAHLIIFCYISWSVNLDIIMSTPPFGCIHCVICSSNRFHSFIFKLSIMIVHTLKTCTSNVVQEQSLVFFVHSFENCWSRVAGQDTHKFIHTIITLDWLI